MDATSQGSPPIPGMESVIATVSGYHGTERFKLIKLIAASGASFVGSMGRSTTHIVCWRLEGKKYEIARRIGTVVVSHRWFEDCLKEGRRVPEEPYTMISGEEAGRISWEMSDVLDTHTSKHSLLSRGRNILSDQSDILCHTLSKEVNASRSDAGNSFWPLSSLLNENFSLNWDAAISSSKTGRKVRKVSKHNNEDKTGRKVRKVSKHNNEDSSRPSFTGSGFLPNEVSSSFVCSSSRQKRKMYDGSMDNGIGESASRSRRVMKKKSPFSILNDQMMDSEQQNCRTRSRGNCLTGSCSLIDITNSESANLENLENSVPSSPVPLTSENTPMTSDGNKVQRLQETSSHIKDCDRVSKGKHSRFPGMTPDEQSQENDSPLQSAGMQTQKEVSCAICWTDFSSTRGILPCGHRFCYSCIEEWSGCLALKRKVSTCPLCKTIFTSILKVEDSSAPDQKIYSQTMPCGLSKMDFLINTDTSDDIFGAGASESVCHRCHNHEPEDLLVSCNICQHQWVHTYCLDPPLVPWTCVHCRDLRMMYQRFR